jgi:membrane protein implicated in regulation of membrane protease activity
MLKRVRAFLAFWYDFVVGEDWTLALGVAAALVGTWALSRTQVPGWWVLPAAVALLLTLSVWRGAPRGRPRGGPG